MIVIETIQDLRAHINKLKQHCAVTAEATEVTEVGFVPTMGFLHAGHASLLQRARQECKIVVLSIFVNPLQFGPLEDLARYPRDPQRDLALAEKAGVDLVFMPQTEEMYPKRMKTTVSVAQLTESL